MERRNNSLEVEIVMVFLENHGFSLEDYDWTDYLCENREDYEEFRDWYRVCCA